MAILASLVILTLTFVAIYVVGYAERFSDDVWTLHLRDCDLDYHIPIRSVALACPGLDYMRLWPLPIQRPWYEPERPGRMAMN